MTENMPDTIGSMPPNDILAASAVLLVAGAIYCFVGYRALKFTIALLGFAAAAGGAGYLVYMLVPDNAIALLIAGAVAGFIGATALLFIFKAGVFCMGLAAAVFTTYPIIMAEGQPWAPWAVLGAALAGGLGAVLLERPVLTLATAAIGAWLIIGAVLYFTLQQQFPRYIEDPSSAGAWRWLVLGCWVVLGLAGAKAQFGSYRKRTATL